MPIAASSTPSTVASRTACAPLIHGREGIAVSISSGDSKRDVPHGHNVPAFLAEPNRRLDEIADRGEFVVAARRPDLFAVGRHFAGAVDHDRDGDALDGPRAA